MRRFDKKKLMKKANILAEKRYLASKGLINENDVNEYDYEYLKHKYSGLPQDKKDALMAKGKERQIRDGIKLRPQKDAETELFALPSDFWLNKQDLKPFEGAPIILNKLTENPNMHGDEFLKLANKFGGHKVLQLIDTSNKKYRDEISFEFSFDIRNVVAPKFDGATIDIDGKMYVTLSALNDKHKPPFSLTAKSIHLNYHGIEGRIIPTDRKGAMRLVNRIKEMLEKEYGKFDTQKPLFLQKINIHPNALIKN